MTETKDRIFGPGHQEICDIGDKVSVNIFQEPMKIGTIIARTVYPIKPTKRLYSYYLYSIKLEDGREVTATSGEVNGFNGLL